MPKKYNQQETKLSAIIKNDGVCERRERERERERERRVLDSIME